MERDVVDPNIWKWLMDFNVGTDAIGTVVLGGKTRKKPKDFHIE